MNDGRISAALKLACDYGQVDGDHHKTWVIDQTVRVLTGNGYEAWVKAGDGPETYEWDEGVAP